MTAKQYHSAIMLSTQAVMQGGQASLPEIIGILEMAKINAERQAYERHKEQNSITIARPPMPMFMPPANERPG